MLAVERVPVTPRVGRYTTEIFLGDRKYFYEVQILTFRAEAAAALGEVGAGRALAAARGAAPGAGPGARGPVARRTQRGQRVLAGRHARAALDI